MSAEQPAWVEVTAGGVRWQLLADLRERLLGPRGLRLDEWLRDGRARVVKQGPHRAVYRIALPGLECYLKHYRLQDTRAWLRELIRPAKARTEYELALQVAARQVPTVTPLALGEQRRSGRPGESFLFLRSLGAVEPLDAFLETRLTSFMAARRTRVRQRLAQALGRFVARTHDAGVFHRDLHAGNILIHLAPDDQPRLYLIDLHDLHVGAPLPWPARRDNLAILNRWFILRASRTDRLRFWRAYGAARRSEILDTSERPREVEDRTIVSNLGFWGHRDHRCLANNRYYRRVRSRAAIGHAVQGFDSALLADLLADPDAPFRWPGVKILKDSPSSTVIEFEIGVGGTAVPVVYKRFGVTAWSDPWVALVRRAPALRSWVFGHGLRERRLPTPRPLLVLHRRRWGLCREGYLLTEKVSGAVDLHTCLADLGRLNGPERRTRRRHIEQLARLCRELHRRRLSDRDLKAANILVRPGDATPDGQAATDFGGLALIDLVGVRRHRQLSRLRRVRDLARLNASFWRDPELTRTDRLHFLRVYLEWHLHGRAAWKRWWRDIDQATRAKIARNARSGRPLS